MPQYVQVRLSGRSSRLYTYVNNHAPVSVGDPVEIELPSGHLTDVEVEAVSNDPPSLPAGVTLKTCRPLGPLEG